MLQICEAVLIGSYAAKLGGFLPEWRNGVTDDIDLICTKEYLSLHRIECKEHVSGRCVVLGPPTLDVEICVADYIKELQRYCEPTLRSFIWNDRILPVWLATKELVWATKVFTVNFNPLKLEDIIKDSLSYDKINPDLHLLDFANNRRKRSLQAAAQYRRINE